MRAYVRACVCENEWTAGIFLEQWMMFLSNGNSSDIPEGL